MMQRWIAEYEDIRIYVFANSQKEANEILAKNIEALKKNKLEKEE